METLERAGRSNFQQGMNVILMVLGVTMVIYHLIAVFLQPLAPVFHANTHLTFVLLLVFLPALQRAVKNGHKIDTLVASALLLLSIIGIVYIYIFSYELISQSVNKMRHS